MRLSLQQIVTYSQCPRKLLYSGISSLPEKTNNHIKDIIKRAYLQRSRDSISWKNIINWVDQSISEQYRQAVNMLTVLDHWYNRIFVEDNVKTVLVNLPVSITISNVELIDTIDLLLTEGDKQTIVLLEQKGLFEAKLKAWLFNKLNGVVPLVEEYRITKMSVQRHQIKLGPLLEDNWIFSIIRNIENNIFYPSINTQCNTCSFKDICTF